MYNWTGTNKHQGRCKICGQYHWLTKAGWCLGCIRGYQQSLRSLKAVTLGDAHGNDDPVQYPPRAADETATAIATAARRHAPPGVVLPPRQLSLLGPDSPEGSADRVHLFRDGVLRRT